MPITCACPSCDHEVTVDDDLEGQKIRCRECDKRFTVEDVRDEAPSGSRGGTKNRPRRAEEPSGRPRESPLLAWCSRHFPSLYRLLRMRLHESLLHVWCLFATIFGVVFSLWMYARVAKYVETPNYSGDVVGMMVLTWAGVMMGDLFLLGFALAMVAVGKSLQEISINTAQAGSDSSPTE